MKRSNCFYMVVTADKYELPVGLFESVLSIALFFKKTRQAVDYAVREHRKFAKKYFIEIVNDDNNSKIAC